MVKNPALAGFAITIRHNLAPAVFGKCKSGTTLDKGFVDAACNS